MKSDSFARKTLGPQELRLASEAFERALGKVGESELHPYDIRKNLAQHVMHKIFAGERDGEDLCNSALAALRGIEVRERRKESRIWPSASAREIHRRSP